MSDGRTSGEYGGYGAGGPAAPDADYIVVGSGAGGGTVAARLAESGFRVLLLEAGPILNQAALNLGVVDKVRLFYAPLVVGCQPPATPNASPAVRKLCDVRIERFGPDFAVEGYLRARRR